MPYFSENDKYSRILQTQIPSWTFQATTNVWSKYQPNMLGDLLEDYCPLGYGAV